MSDTPETNAAELIYDGIVASGYADANVCRKLERERDKAQALVAEMKQAIIWAKAEAKERLHRLDQAACERRTWLEAHEKMKRERDEAREAFSIATSNCVDAQQRLREMQDQRDFAMGEIERLKRGRDNYRQALESLLYSTEEWVNSHVPANRSLDFIKKINTRIRKQLRGVWK